MDIAGMSVIITGAAKGIGKSIACMMASRGAVVSLCDIAEETLAATAGEIVAAGGTVHSRRVDVAEQDQVTDFVNFSLEKMGHIDVLVNNAGIYILKPVADISIEEWDRVMLVNLRSCFMFCQTVLPHMQERRFGRIINMASAAGKNGGTVCGAHYAASKGGILALTRHLARQVSRDGITVNAVAPALIAADMMLNLSPEQLQPAINSVPVGRLGTVEEVAESVCYLADRSSSFVTGETININGGIIMD